MVSQRMLQLGTARSVIRELFEYGRQRAAEVGAENVFDFSLGNPSVPAPAAVNETAIPPGCGSRGIPSTATPAPPVIPVPGSALPIP